MTIPQPILDLCLRYSQPAVRGGWETVLEGQGPDEANLESLQRALRYLGAALDLASSTVYPELQRYITESIAADNLFMKRRDVVSALFHGIPRLIEILDLNQTWAAS